MKSISAPYCPECKQKMTRVSGGSWQCGCTPSQPEIRLAPKEKRTQCVRVLLTPSEETMLLARVDGGSVSSYGRDAILEKLRRDQEEQVVAQLGS